MDKITEPDIFAIPGMAVCGCLLWSPAIHWGFFATSAIFALFVYFVAGVAGRVVGCCALEDVPESSFLTKFSGRILALLSIVLLALVCVFTEGWILTASFAVFLLIWLLSYHFSSCEKHPAFRRFVKKLFFAMKYVFALLLGVFSSIAAEHCTVLNPWRCAIVLLFCIGVFLYYFGIARASEGMDVPVQKRPGRFLFLSGCVVSYAVLFGIVMRRPTQCWLNLLSGAVSAITAAVFVIIVYWCFRVLQYPVSERDCRKWLSLLFFNIFFLQLATVTAFVSFGGLIVVAILMTVSVWVSKRIANAKKAGEGKNE